MPDKSEVIMEQMEGTRKDLADKVEKLEHKIAGTVETVSDTVSTVTETVENVKESIAQTVQTVTGSVQHTVEAVSDTVGSTVQTVKRSLRDFFDVPGHVRRHPWLALGGSVLVGYLGGRLLLPRPERDATTGAPAPTPTAAPTYTPTPTPAYTPAPAPAAREEPKAEGDGWLSRLAEQFAPQLNHLKGMAIGTALGAVRDMVSAWAPEAVRKDVTEMINGFTSNLGGQVIQGPVFGESEPAGGGYDDSTSTHRADAGTAELAGRHEEAETATTRKSKGGRGRR